MAFNLSPRNLTQVTSAMKQGKECMVGFCFGEENNSSLRVILKIEPELNNLNSILSRSAVTPVFPRILSMDSHPVSSRDYGSPHIVGFSFFTTDHTNFNGSTRWGSPLRPPPWVQPLILTVHRLGLIPPDIPTVLNLHL